MPGCPKYMDAFKPVDEEGSKSSEWDSWSAPYQPDGGSVNIKACYQQFLQFARENGVTILDETKVLGHMFIEQD